jgi:hypothetical protein
MPRLLGKSWLDSFLEYTEWMEAPREWLLWSGISCISSTLKRSCYLWYRGIKFFPNQYIILVGPPGIGKGEAISKGYEIANEAKSINYIKDWHTPQEILEELADGFQHMGLKPGQVITTNVIQDHTCCIMAPELAVFLQQYDNLHSLMCAWWDQNKFDYKTKNKGKHIIEDMSVSLLGGCVPDYVRSLSKDRLAPITGGFTARTIFVYATEKFQLVKDNFGIPTQRLQDLRTKLVNDLKHISTLQGELSVEKDAIKLWTEVYESHNKRGIIDSDASTNFKSRISSHIIKTVISICMAESDSFTVTRNQLERAIEYVEQIRDKVDIVFRCVGESPLANIQAKIINYIDSQGSVTYKTLLKAMYRDATQEQVDQIMRLLVQVGVVKEKFDVNSQPYYESIQTVTIKISPRGAVNP